MVSEYVIEITGVKSQDALEKALAKTSLQYGIDETFGDTTWIIVTVDSNDGEDAMTSYVTLEMESTGLKWNLEDIIDQDPDFYGPITPFVSEEGTL